MNPSVNPITTGLAPLRKDPKLGEIAIKNTQIEFASAPAMIKGRRLPNFDMLRSLIIPKMG